MQGCDASVMIASPNGDAEKDAQDNLSLAGDGFDTVIKAKQAVESVCPGVVSCADILTIAARDVVASVRLFIIREMVGLITGQNVSNWEKSTISANLIYFLDLKQGR